MTQKEYIELVGPIIQNIAFKRGYRYPSAIIAQACLESNYGKSSLASRYNNHFGMKCGGAWTGKSVNLATKEEYTPGTLTNIKAFFRAYDSLEEGIQGYFEFIQARRYQNLKEATSPRDYLEKIKADGYATSVKYVDNLMKVIDSKGLTLYDMIGQPEAPTNTQKEHELEVVARKVIAGYYGNGAARKIKLQREGYNYHEVQKMVNKILGGEV